MSTATTHINTENKRIPELRFKEFEGEWKSKQLKKICSFFSGGTPTSSNRKYYIGDIPFIGSGNIFDSEVSNFITKEALNNSSAKIVEVGDLLYALYGANSGAVGISKMSGAINQAILCIRTETENIEFIHCLLILNKDKIVNRYLQGGQGNLSANIIKKLKYNFPSLPEQQKIATFLTAVDSKIQQLTKKKTLLEQYKKGVMQQLFSGQLRFKANNGNAYPDWEEKKLGEIATKVSSNISANTIEENMGEFKLYGASGLLKKIDFFREEKPYVSIVKDGAGVGRTLLCDANSSVLGTLDIIKPKVDVVLYFLYSVLNNIRFEKYMVGSTIPHIYYKDYSSERIKIPYIKEQQKIATYLSSIDTKIESVTNKITQTQSFKKGLLQQMFV